VKKKQDIFKTITLGLATILPATPALADRPDNELEELAEQVEDVGNATNRIIVPVPISDPQLGTGLGLGVAWFYQPEGSDIPWTTGVGGLSTSNGSWGVAAFHSMALDGDRFRIRAALGKGRMNTKYFPGIGGQSRDDQYVELSQDATFAQARVTTSVVNNLFVGGMLRHVDMTMQVNKIVGLPPDADLPPDFDPVEQVQDVKLFSYGPVFTYDSTAGSFSPRSGVKIDAEWLITDADILREFSYNKASITANQYFGIAERSVLAFRQSLCSASEDAPFFAECQFGSNANLRGYVSGMYRDNASWSTQAEWRQQISGKFGAVAFAGIGGVARNLGSLTSADILPAAGAGVRYLVAEDYRVNLRLDFAWGRHSNGIYVSVGEAF
jgi:hypothetical protein